MKKLITLISLTFLSTYGLYFYKFHGPLADSQDKWGQFGDFAGGTLNPILTFITIFILYKTIRLQQESLDKTNDALKLSEKSYNLSRTELALSREEFSRSTNVLESQNGLIQLQKFEGAFFELIKLLIEDIARSEFLFNGSSYKGSSGTDRLIHDFLEEIESTKSDKNIMDFLDNDNDMYALAKLSSGVFNFVNTSNLSKVEKEGYISLLASVLPPSTIGALCFIKIFADWPTLKLIEESGFFCKQGVAEALEVIAQLETYKTPKK